MVVTPVLTLFLPAKLAIGMMAPMMIMADIAIARYYWGKWDKAHLKSLTITCIVGVVIGSYFIYVASDLFLKRSIGFVALAFACYQLVVSFLPGKASGIRPRRGVGELVGLLGGITSAIAHVGGVVIALYLIGRKVSKEAIVATLFGVFVTSNIFKLFSYYQIKVLTTQILIWDLYGIPFIAIGGYLGYRLNRSINWRAFNFSIIAIALASSLKLLLF